MSSRTHMSHLSRSLFVMVLTAFIGTGAASGQTIEPSESLRVFVDLARFRGNNGNVYVEFYYSFAQRGLTYTADSAGMSAGVDLSLTIHRSDSLVYNDRWVVPHRIADTTAIQHGVNLVAISAAELPPGMYRADVTGRDLRHPERSHSSSLRFPVDQIRSTGIVLSDLELANNIVPGREGTPFYKNTLEVIPNASSIFGEEQVCYVYAEVYNVLSGEDLSDYTVRMVVLDAARREVVGHEKSRKRVAESGIIVDQIPIRPLATGTYTVAVTLLDSAGHLLSVSGKKFFVYNPTVGVDTSLVIGAGLLGGLYASMSEGDLDREFAWAKYEARPEDEKRYHSLTDVDAKRSFLAEFWGSRPAGLRDAYLERVAFANSRYKVIGWEGYRTDRGRVHIMYGPADDYDRHPNEPDTRPYEIWEYQSIQGGVIFVFVQRVAGAQYELVHSTHRNELQDPLWKEHYATPGR